MASRETGIAERYMKAIEENRFDCLPGMVYGKNFVRQYAQYLHLAPAPMVRMFVEEYRGATMQSRQRTASRIKGALITPLRVRFGIGVLLGMLVIWYLGGEVRTLIAPPPLLVTSPVTDVLTEERTIRIEGTTDSRARLMVNNRTITNSSGSFIADVDLQEGVNTIIVRAVTRHGRERVVERNVVRTSATVAQEDRGKHL